MPRGYGGMLPQKSLKFRVSEMSYFMHLGGGGGGKILQNSDGQIMMYILD